MPGPNGTMARCASTAVVVVTVLELGDLNNVRVGMCAEHIRVEGWGALLEDACRGMLGEIAAAQSGLIVPPGAAT